MRRKRMIVTGLRGQVVSSLVARGALTDDFEIVAIGRPMLDLAIPATVGPAMESAAPDIIVSAAAYTAVDRAEGEEELAMRINHIGAGAAAAAAARLGVPIIHLSTDYVFDGSKTTPYSEDDPVAPLGVYGRSKLAGERTVQEATDNHAILRTAWVYSPFGNNFLKTMLRLAHSRDSISVVDDQVGNPTSALELADGILAVARRLTVDGQTNLRGIFHMTGRGEASWADFAERIFAVAQLEGGPFARVDRIPSAAYPTPASRPTNSRLDCGRLEHIHGVVLPAWQDSTAEMVKLLLAPPQHYSDL